MEVIEDLHSPTLTPPPPSQPCGTVTYKPVVSAKPLKSEFSAYYDKFSTDDEVIEVDGNRDGSLLRGSKCSLLPQVCGTVKTMSNSRLLSGYSGLIAAL